MCLTPAVETFVKTNIPDPAAKQRDALTWAALTRCHRNSSIVAKRSPSAIFSQSYWSLQTSRGGGAASSYPAGWPFLPAWAQASSPQVKANCHQLWSPATNKHTGCSSSESSTPAFWSGTSPRERGGHLLSSPTTQPVFAASAFSWWGSVTKAGCDWSLGEKSPRAHTCAGSTTYETFNKPFAN